MNHKNITRSHIFMRMASSATQNLTNPSRINHPTRFPTQFNPVRSAANPRIKLPKGLVYNPTPSPLSPYDTPEIFLPKHDSRTIKYETKQYPVKFMPALTQPSDKSYHLSEKDAIEIQKLRLEDPEKWTRKALAAKFNCSPLTVSFVSAPEPERAKEMHRRLSVIKSIWNPRRARARNDRQRRREFWKQDRIN